MAKPKADVERAPSQPKFSIRDLWRLTLWGVAAAGAVGLAVYAGTTEIGQARLRTAFAGIHETLMPSGVKPNQPLDAREGRRLAETLRTLAADRERMSARLDTLEHNIEDITGSIARVQQAAVGSAAARPSASARANPPPEPQAAPASGPALESVETAPPAAAATAPTPTPKVAAAPEPRRAPATSDDVTSSIAPQSGVPMPPAPPSPSPGSTPGKTQFGLDLGSASTVEALRTAWTVAVRRHGPVLQGLHPMVQMRERPRGGGTDLHLIAGPLPSAATAARLCGTMTAASAICTPTVFDGQRLAIR